MKKITKKLIEFKNAEGRLNYGTNTDRPVSVGITKEIKDFDLTLFKNVSKFEFDNIDK